MNQTCVNIGPMFGTTLQCPKNNQNEECSRNGVRRNTILLQLTYLSKDLKRNRNLLYLYLNCILPGYQLSIEYHLLPLSNL